VPVPACVPAPDGGSRGHGHELIYPRERVQWLQYYSPISIIPKMTQKLADEENLSVSYFAVAPFMR
jgi:hypothetical protein